MTDSEKLIRALYCAYNKLASSKSRLDSLNVFPVADSDTGSNMCRTMKAGVEAIRRDESLSVQELLEKASKSMLRFARGNSGVILSILFKGFSDSLKTSSQIHSGRLYSAFDNALKGACDILSSPVLEGTILSVVISCRDTCKDMADETLSEAFEKIADSAEAATEKTRFILEPMKKANVVDSGALGLSLILRSVSDFLSGKRSTDIPQGRVVFRKQPIKSSAPYAYCTEYIIIKKNSFPLDSLEKRLNEIGDSVAVVPDDDIIKVHLHTNFPDRALSFAMRYGSLSDIKIDNMLLSLKE